MSKIHYLKLNEQYWGAVMDGKKTFEVRKNDRDFCVGDQIIFLLVENDVITSHSSPFYIEYVLKDAAFFKDGFCAFSIRCPINA